MGVFASRQLEKLQIKLSYPGSTLPENVFSVCNYTQITNDHHATKFIGQYSMQLPTLSLKYLFSWLFWLIIITLKVPCVFICFFLAGPLQVKGLVP